MMAITCCARWLLTAAFSRTMGLVRRRRGAGESIEEALRREVREELGEKLQLARITPWSFRDDTRVKTYPDGRQETIYMIYLIFDCVSANRDVTINEEFDDYAWVKADELKNYDLNAATRLTLSMKGLL